MIILGKFSYFSIKMYFVGTHYKHHIYNFYGKNWKILPELSSCTPV